MTVIELIEQLKKEDPDSLVVMAKDSEGNSHSPLADFWLGCYKADSTWSGDVGFCELTPELKNDGYDENDIISDGVKAIILCPIN